MSSTNYVHVHQSEGVVISDLAALNQAIDASLQEPVGTDMQYWTEPQSTLKGFVSQDASGSVLLARTNDDEWAGYHPDYVQVYEFHETQLKIIADHITDGKLVIRYEPEGWPDDFYILTQGKCEKKPIGEVKF